MKTAANKPKKSKKTTIFMILGIIAAAIVLLILICLLPYLILVGGLLGDAFLIYPSKPVEEHGEFPFELVYEYKGEQKTIKDTIICDYEGYSWSLEGGNSRDWNCEFSNDEEYGYYYIDKENYPELYISIPEAGDYYMGDKEYTKEDAEPIIYYSDESSGTYYEEKEKIDVVDIKIIEWKPSEPLKGNIK